MFAQTYCFPYLGHLRAIFSRRYSLNKGQYCLLMRYLFLTAILSKHAIELRELSLICTPPLQCAPELHRLATKVLRSRESHPCLLQYVCAELLATDFNGSKLARSMMLMLLLQELYPREPPRIQAVAESFKMGELRVSVC